MRPGTSVHCSEGLRCAVPFGASREQGDAASKASHRGPKSCASVQLLSKSHRNESNGSKLFFEANSSFTIKVVVCRHRPRNAMSPDTLSLAGKVAIITGSGRENGIGAGIARALARNGAAVTINCVSDATVPRAEALAQTLREEGQKASVVQADIRSYEGAKKLVDETLKAFGCDKVDILSTLILPIASRR